MSETGRIASTARPFGPVYLKPDEGRSASGMPFAPSFVVLGQRVTLRGAAAAIEDLPTGIDLLREYLWSNPSTPKTNWKPQLVNHLRTIYPSSGLMARVERLADVDPCRRIHGDATLANLLRFPFGVRWIDPLDRPYVPGDPLVDAGKILQSCYGYENVLAGRKTDQHYLYQPRVVLEALLDEFGDSGLDRARTWSLVHLARLLRYHTPGVQNWAIRILESYGCYRD